MTPTEYLDQLDQARDKGTPGTWGVGNGTDIVTEVDQVSRGGYGYRYEVAEVDDDRDPASGWPTKYEDMDNPADPEDDAALIVAAVNALPKLTAALRAVLELIDPENGMATGNGYDSTRLFDEKDIRAAITEALGGEL